MVLFRHSLSGVILTRQRIFGVASTASSIARNEQRLLAIEQANHIRAKGFDHTVQGAYAVAAGTPMHSDVYQQLNHAFEIWGRYLTEGLSVEETAEVLQIPTGTVKTRLLRSRRRLQRELDPEIREALHDTFPFAGRDCDAMSERVLQKFLQDPT